MNPINRVLGGEGGAEESPIEREVSRPDFWEDSWVSATEKLAD